MNRIRPLLMIVALLGALVVFAACNGGSDDGDENGGDGTPAATSENGDGGEDGENGDGEGDGGNGDSGDIDDLTELAERFTDAAFRGEYTLTGAPGEELESGTLVLLKGSDGRVRFELSAEEAGETIEIILIETPDTSAFCLVNAGEFGALLGVPEGEGVCFEDDPTFGAGAGNFNEILDEIEAGEWEVLERSEREIAGEDATCFRTRDAAGEISDVCFNDDGYLLAAVQQDGSGIEAMSVGGDVEDGDFDLPYEVRELPNLGE